MTKSEYRALVEKYDMTIMTHPITRQNWGHYLDTDHYIDELDAIVDRKELDNVNGTRSSCVDDGKLIDVRYTIIPPANWFDLWGLKD